MCILGSIAMSNARTTIDPTIAALRTPNPTFAQQNQLLASSRNTRGVLNPGPRKFLEADIKAKADKAGSTSSSSTSQQSVRPPQSISRGSTIASTNDPTGLGVGFKRGSALTSSVSSIFAQRQKLGLKTGQRSLLSIR